MAIHHRLLHGHRPHPPGRKSKIQTARLEFRFWILDFGFWVLDLGFGVSDFGFWIVAVSALCVEGSNAAV